MMNQVFCVGRLVQDPTVETSENGKERTRITLAVPRAYKNADGEYDTDFLDCTLWGQIASNTTEYCHKGDLVGVKGRIETSTYEKDGEKKKSTHIVADRVTFLSSRSKDIQDEIDKSEDDELDM